MRPQVIQQEFSIRLHGIEYPSMCGMALPLIYISIFLHKIGFPYVGDIVYIVYVSLLLLFYLVRFPELFILFRNRVQLVGSGTNVLLLMFALLMQDCAPSRTGFENMVYRDYFLY